MDQLMTPDGAVCIFDSQKDISELCRKYISDDVARYVYDLIGDVDLEKEMLNLQYDDDYLAMEQENEYWRNKLDEINSQLQQLSCKADEPGFSKKKVIAEIDKMWQHLQKIL